MQGAAPELLELVAHQVFCWSRRCAKRAARAKPDTDTTISANDAQKDATAMDQSRNEVGYELEVLSAASDFCQMPT